MHPYVDNASLKPSECDEFLGWLFGGVARRSQKMDLQETARAARLLLQLASVGVPIPNAPLKNVEWRQARDKTLEMVRIIVVTCLQAGHIVPYSKQKTRAYLEKHDGTYLTHPYLETVKMFLESTELPLEIPSTSRQSILMSRSIQRSGGFSPRLPDDLSERIYVAYSALTSAQVAKARRRIADALQAAGIQRKLGTRSSIVNASEWDEDDVYDRVKKFERTFCRDQERGRSKLVAQHRRLLSEHWITQFRAHKELKGWFSRK